MSTSSIRYPDDASNTGPREATRTFTEDSVTKHLPRFIPETNRVRAGVYFAHSGALTVQAAAHGAGAGFLWIVNHVGSSPDLVIRRIRFSSQHNTALATPTGPRILVERFTFTGTPSGGQITVAKRRASDAAASSTWSIRTANTGMTQTAGAGVCAFHPVGAITAVGATPPGYQEWAPFDRDEDIFLDAGEGVRIYQPDAGTTADTRRFFMDFTLEEVTSEF